MHRLLADVHADGHLARIAQICRGPAWIEVWDELGVEAFCFSDFRLETTITDASLWEFCQQNHLLLITANRTSADPDSLEQTIRDRNTTDSFPVITLANLRQFRASRDYRERAAISLLEILLDFERYRGAGRIYIPSFVPS
jgi:hypothetical protein